MKSKNNSKNIKGQIQATGKGSPKKIVSNMNNIKNQNNIKNINSLQQKQKAKQNLKNNNKINQFSSNGVKNISNNNKKILPNNNIYNINNKNNNYNKVQSKSVKRVNDIKNKISPPKEIKLKDYQFIEYHPYTLKDYREMIRNPVVLGHLGPNIGTKEWEEKKNKMRKMMNYSNNINKEHKGINKLKKDTPKDEIEKLTKEKIEKSARHKTYEYGKLLRNGKYKEDFDDKEFNNFNLNNNINDNKLEDIQENEINNNNEKEKENEMSYEQLIKQNELYESNIKDIRDHILD